MLLGKLGASLLGNILAGKRAIATSHGRGMNRDGEGIVRAGYGNNHPLTKFEIQKYQNKSRFNGVYSRDNFC